MNNPTIANIKKTEFQVASAETITAIACAQIGSDEAIIVTENEGGPPIGVLPPEEVVSLGTSQLPLASHRSRYEPPTFVLSSTLVVDVLRAMRYDKSIRWQIVLQEGKATALVSPEELFAVARSTTGAKGSAASLAAALYGDPLTEPSGLCYLCSAEPTHTIQPERVEDRTADGQALCPCDHTTMVGTFVCPSEFSSC